MNEPARAIVGDEQEPRFEFGANWQKFLANVDDEAISQSIQAVSKVFGDLDLAGRTFLDVGSGSGLSSLAARRLGARVTSFDYDTDSVAATNELRSRFAPNDADWRIMQGSILDPEFLATLGTFDVVYSWGVLHHTGAMWDALDNAAGLVRPGGSLMIAIYNDQGRRSRMWTRLKRLYVRSPRVVRGVLLAIEGTRLLLPSLIRDVLRGRSLGAWRRGPGRGMSRWRNLIDWAGGYPFEVARPEEIVDFGWERGFELKHLKTCGGGLGCNEYTFELAQDATAPASR